MYFQTLTFCCHLFVTQKCIVHWTEQHTYQSQIYGSGKELV